MTELDDIFRAQSGDREAFGRLVTRYHDLVFGICYGMTSQTVDAEDLAHEAFVEAFLKLRALRDPERFAGWLRTLTLNVCRMWHRKRKRDSVDVFSEKHADEVRQLNGYFAKLSESHRLSLALHYWEGLSYEEMARFLDVPIGTVMSRLSRARQALKEVMEQSEDMEMDEGRDLQLEVDSEIEVLLKLFGDDVDSMERLSVVLEKSPDRFREVICHVEDGATVKQVGRLVRHFGKPAVDATLGCYFDGDAEQKSKAFSVLVFLLQDWVDRNSEKSYTMPMIQGTYFILDGVIQSAYPLSAQVALLIDLVEESERSVRMALACTLRSFGNVAFDMLMDRFQALENPGERSKGDGLGDSLRLFGSRVFEDVLPFLRSEKKQEILLGLRGVNAVVGNLDRDWLHRDTVEERRISLRTRGLMFSNQMDQDIVEAVTQAIAVLVSHTEKEIRNWAIEILARFPLGAHLITLRSALTHTDQETQVVTMRCLAELGDRGCVPILVDAARSREGLVLRKTIEALGQLQASEAQPLMEELLDHPARMIREAAVLALGNVGNEDARRKLQAMTVLPDKKMARLAARALYGGDQYRHRGKSSALTRARLQKIRGDAKPNPLLHRSIAAAIKCLPEIRVYEETDLTQRIARVCADYSTTRRHLVSGRDRVMTRDQGLYTFTEMGEAVWRVEQFIQERFLDLDRY